MGELVVKISKAFKIEAIMEAYVFQHPEADKRTCDNKTAKMICRFHIFTIFAIKTAK